MFQKITRYSKVSAKALKEILLSYADAGKSTDPALLAKVAKVHNEQKAKWKSAGWKEDEKGNWQFGNQIPQVFTKEHPQGRAPITEDVKRAELYEFIDSTCDEYGEAKVAKWINNGFSLGLRQTMKKKPSDGVAYAEALQSFINDVLMKLGEPGNSEIAAEYQTLRDDDARKSYIIEWYTPDEETD